MIVIVYLVFVGVSPMSQAHCVMNVWTHSGVSLRGLAASHVTAVLEMGLPVRYVTRYVHREGVDFVDIT